MNFARLTFIDFAKMGMPLLMYTGDHSTQERHAVKSMKPSSDPEVAFKCAVENITMMTDSCMVVSSITKIHAATSNHAAVKTE